MAKAFKYKQKTNNRRAGSIKEQFRALVRAYVPLMVVVVVALVINDQWLANSHGVLGASTAISPTSLLSYTNAQRKKYGESSLTLNVDLMKAAQAKANNMVKLNYWSHDTPSGQPPWVFIQKAGYNYHKAGENLAYGFPNSASVMNAWMHSPEHRANILDSSFTNVGFGIAYSPDYQNQGPQILVDAMYGQPSSVANAVQINTLPNSAVFAPSTQRLSWAQYMIGNDSIWVVTSIISITLLLLVYMVYNHGRKWKRLISRGEAFIVHHPLIDLAAMSLIMFGVVISSTAGYIG